MSSDDSWQDDDYANYNWHLPIQDQDNEKIKIVLRQNEMIKNEITQKNQDEKILKIHEHIMGMQLKILKSTPKIVIVNGTTIIDKFIVLLLLYLCLVLTYIFYNIKDIFFIDNKHILHYSIFA